MAASYTIDLDTELQLATIYLTGFFLEQDVMQLQDALKRELQARGWGFRRHLVMCDITGMKIQPQKTVELFTELMADPLVQSKRLAFVAHQSLARFQAKRLTNREGVMFFETIVKAKVWLLDDRFPICFQC